MSIIAYIYLTCVSMKSLTSPSLNIRANQFLTGCSFPSLETRLMQAYSWISISSKCFILTDTNQCKSRYGFRNYFHIGRDQDRPFQTACHTLLSHIRSMQNCLHSLCQERIREMSFAWDRTTYGAAADRSDKAELVDLEFELDVFVNSPELYQLICSIVSLTVNAR